MKERGPLGEPETVRLVVNYWTILNFKPFFAFYIRFKRVHHASLQCPQKKDPIIYLKNSDVQLIKKNIYFDTHALL